MDPKEFNTYLARLPELTPRQHRKLVDVLRVKDDAKVVVETLEKRVAETRACPHCGQEQLQRWGRAHGMQRYRCKSCGRTWNAATGTPLARLRKKDKWIAHSQAMIEGLSLRKAAAQCQVHPSTSFRWRHRFLQGIKDKKDPCLKGIVEADETFFLESFKGSRTLPRPARKRGGKAMKRGLSAEQIPVLIARDRHGNMSDDVLNDLTKASVTNVLKPLLATDVILCTDGNNAYKALANSLNIKHVRLVARQGKRVVDKVYHIQNVNAYDSRLKGWMGRFRGVATKYLPNYLGWRRLLEKQGKDISPPTYLSCAAA